MEPLSAAPVSPSTVRFGVLGPLAVWENSRQLPVAGVKRRMLLATLLLRPNLEVPSDRLAAALWPDPAPRSAMANLRTYVSELRAILPPIAGEPRIRRHPAGYSIAIASGELDLDLFDDLIRQAGDASGVGRIDESLRLLKSAVGLCRGEPLEDLPDMPAWQAEKARIIERRLTALEQMCAHQFALGRHADTIAEVRSLIVAHPLHEGLWRQLLLALHATGRQAEALEAYAELRRQLIAELGTEPGPELRRAHQALLLGDTPTTGQKTGTERAVFPLCQLPPDVPDFTGRGAAVSELITILAVAADGRPPPIAVTTGAPGVGKSALALHVAHTLRATFPDGQLYLDLGGTAERAREPADVLVEVLRALGFTGGAIPQGLGERSALYRSLLADRRVLVLLDNAAHAEQVRPLLPATSGTATLITSRYQLTDLPGARRVDVDVFHPAEAVELLARIAGPERAAREPAQAAAIAHACGNLPLAIRIAGAKLSGRQSWPLSVLGERLDDESRRLSELQIGNLGVRPSFDMSIRLLDPQAARAFRLLGSLGAQELPGWVVGPLLGRADADDVLDTLIDANLIHPVRTDAIGQPRYRLHDLLRHYAAQAAAADPAPDRDAALTRLLGAWLTLAERAAGGLPASILTTAPGHAPRHGLPTSLTDRLMADPLAWFDAERRPLLDAVTLAARHGLHELTWELAVSTIPYFDQRSLYNDWLSSHRQALHAVRAAANHRGEAALMRGISQVYVYQDRYEDALAAADESRRLSQDIGDAWGAANATVGMATVHRILGRTTQALDHYQRALPAVIDAGDHHLEAQIRSSIAAIHLAGNRPQHARTWFDDALRLARTLHDQHREANIVCQRATLLISQGRRARALDDLRWALSVFETMHDERCAAYAMLGLAHLHTLQGARADAEVMLDSAWAIFRWIGNRRGQAATLQRFGELWIAQGMTAEGRACLQQAHHLSRDIGDTAQATVIESSLWQLSG
ncbi:AfsR/SARP family transcriptional regulator [Nonomuraea lactucae]|uniref:AfsR/SARP family transcriptional regulator n=1 Tax=Nonomuraea lactucae TaxID=2249762 RepID=UPI000DE4A6DD|nr:BTAD domain-containing putative transcriptional regulator [Nonomuraea lactucae]